MSFDAKSAIGAGVGVVVGCLLGLVLSKAAPPMMAPTADSKAEQAYRRSGFGDRIMTLDRRIRLSDCYKNMLKENGYDAVNPTPKPSTNPEVKAKAFEGKVIYVFHVAEDGRMLDFELIDSEFQDKNLESCISGSLTGIRFLPPPLGINRHLAHEFVFKSDETFRREMEERKNQAPLQLLTPAPGQSPAEGSPSK